MMQEHFKKGIRRVCSLWLLAATLALAGCGSSSPVTSVIDLQSPGVDANGVTQPSVHCGWGAIWVPLEWKGVPEGTKELAIYIGRFKYQKEGNARKLVVPYADLVNQIKPTLRKLPANVLPEGAGWSRTGQITCPPFAQGQRVLVEVFALDRVQEEREMKSRLATRLTEEALADPHPTTGPRSPGKLTEDTAAIGRLVLTYPGPHNLALYR